MFWAWSGLAITSAQIPNMSYSVMFAGAFANTMAFDSSVFS